MSNDFYLPITVDNLPPLTSGEVTPLNAIVMLTQLNRVGLYETYKIDLEDYKLLFTNTIVNYTNVLNIFSPSNSNIIFGTYINPSTNLDQITLNFSTTAIDQTIQNLEDSTNNKFETLTEQIRLALQDFYDNYLILESKINLLAAYNRYQINDPIDVLLQSNTIINIATQSLKLNQVITFTTNPINVEVVNFNYNITITIDATTIDEDYFNLINFTLDLQKLPTTDTSSITANNNSIIIYVYLPGGIIKEFRRVGQIIPTNLTNLIILNGQFNIFI
jgi:hypothetical protein